MTRHWWYERNACSPPVSRDVTVVKSGVFQSEGLLYMVYVSTAVLDAARTARDHARLR